MLFPRQLAKDKGGESADSLMEEGHQPIRRETEQAIRHPRAECVVPEAV